MVHCLSLSCQMPLFPELARAEDQLDVVGPILQDTNGSVQFTEHQHLQLISVGQ